jgi:hypothetical protein
MNTQLSIFTIYAALSRSTMSGAKVFYFEWDWLHIVQC